ncbi:MAG: flagellar basal body rod protein FlgC [Lachnospiraceae bacterium]|jgi:flagellar basal-body rod protein FlgC|nr:flagellar basal body rod protein FlgC [Lachnospiraceae bacterium]
MGLFTSFDINASGLTAQRYRMDVIAQNIANANTTRTENGDTYRRKGVIFAEKGTGAKFSNYLTRATGNYKGGGVKVVRTFEDRDTDLIKAYDPSHPDADEDGYVYYPNVNIITEMTNLIDASRSYEANATAFNASKSIATTGLNMGQS